MERWKSGRAWRGHHFLSLVGAPALDPCIGPLHLHVACPASSAQRLDKDHPDKDGLQLRAISHVLKIFDNVAKTDCGPGCKVGVFIDCPQRSGASEEEEEEIAWAKPPQPEQPPPQSHLRQLRTQPEPSFSETYVI